MAIAERAATSQQQQWEVQDEALGLQSVVDPVPTLTAYISFYPHWNGAGSTCPSEFSVDRCI